MPRPPIGGQRGRDAGRNKNSSSKAKSCINCGNRLNQEPDDDAGVPIGLRLGALGIPVLVRANGHDMCSVPEGAACPDWLRRLRRQSWVASDGLDTSSSAGFLPMRSRRASSLPPAPEAGVRARSRERLRPACTKNHASISGLVALAGSGQSQYTCLVEKRNGRLGFPKGLSLADEKSCQATVLQKWQEDVKLHCEKLHLDAEMLTDAAGCCYAVAECDYAAATLRDVASLCKTWTAKSSSEGTGADGVVAAHWMLLEEALVHPQLPHDSRELLGRAKRQVRCVARWLAADQSMEAPHNYCPYQKAMPQHQPLSQSLSHSTAPKSTGPMSFAPRPPSPRSRTGGSKSGSSSAAAWLQQPLPVGSSPTPAAAQEDHEMLTSGPMVWL